MLKPLKPLKPLKSLGPKSGKLIPGEKVIFEIRPSFFILAGRLLPIAAAIAGILVIFAFAGIYNFWLYIIVFFVGVFIVLVIYLGWYFTIFRLTNRRVENRCGIFGIREEEVALVDVQNVDIVKTFWGTIFNFGTVVIKSSGADRQVDFINVADARKVANKVEDLALGHFNNKNHH